MKNKINGKKVKYGSISQLVAEKNMKAAEEGKTYNLTNGLTDIAALLSEKEILSYVDCQDEMNQIHDYLYKGLEELEKNYKGSSQKVERVVYFDSRNNGLSFDWNVNNKMSPFRMFYSKTMGASSESTAVMCYLRDDGTLSGAYFTDDGNKMEPHDLPDVEFKGSPSKFISKFSEKF